MVVGADPRRQIEGEIGATRKMYIRQYSEQGSYAHGVVHGILPTFFTTTTTPAMHDNDRSSRADDLRNSSVSSVITNPAAPDPGYIFRLSISAAGSSYPSWPNDFPMFFSLAFAEPKLAAWHPYPHAFIVLETKQDKARRKPSSPAFNKRAGGEGFSRSRHLWYSPCTYPCMHASPL